MRSIPTAIDTDAEDVVWALQTADALWKRQERVDAIVWLRRAAQAAGEAEDDDRALELARGAAELAEWMAQNSEAAPGVRPSPTSAPPAAGEAVDDLLRDPADEPDVDEATPVSEQEVVFTAPPPAVPRSPAPPAPPVHVPTAAEAHAGMLDPWSDPESPTRNRPVVPAPVAPVAPAAPTVESDEVVTSAPPVTPPDERVAAPLPTPPRPPPRPQSPPPPRNQPPRLRVETPVAAPAPPVPAPSPPITTSVPQVSAPAPQVPTTPLPQVPAPAPRISTPAQRRIDNGVDLSEVEALSDLPDDARAAFADAATVQTLAREDEVSGFALALVLEGSVDLSATIVDAAAQRLDAGAVLRARGTIEPFSPVRLVGASETARVAIWNEHAVTEAFRSCPWVEDELRAAADRQQALVGITMGPLGERLDPSLRADVMNRLQLRTLAEHEVITTRGSATVGLLVVGGGELEFLSEDGTPSGAVLRPGEFLFPNESLRAAPAPSTVRAARGGALVLMAERGVAQELLVTCPPLLEIFAGG
jgi:hypothetical protein